MLKNTTVPPRSQSLLCSFAIDRLLPADRFSEPNAAAHASLDAQIERHKAIVGNSEHVLDAAQDAEDEALDTLVWTPPTGPRPCRPSGNVPKARVCG
jgi:hypothetical protein